VVEERIEDVECPEEMDGSVRVIEDRPPTQVSVLSMHA